MVIVKAGALPVLTNTHTLDTTLRQPRFEKEGCLKELLKEYRRLGSPFQTKKYTPAMAMAEVKEMMKLLEIKNQNHPLQDEVPEVDIPIGYQVEFSNGDWYVCRCSDGGTTACAKLPPIDDDGDGVYSFAYDDDVNLLVTQGINVPHCTFKVSDFLGTSDDETGEQDGALGDLPHGLSHKPSFLPGMEELPSPPGSPLPLQNHDGFVHPKDNLFFTFMTFLNWCFRGALQRANMSKE